MGAFFLAKYNKDMGALELGFRRYTILDFSRSRYQMNLEEQRFAGRNACKDKREEKRRSRGRFEICE